MIPPPAWMLNPGDLKTILLSFFLVLVLSSYAFIAGAVWQYHTGWIKPQDLEAEPSENTDQ